MVLHTKYMFHETVNQKSTADTQHTGLPNICLRTAIDVSHRNNNNNNNNNNNKVTLLLYAN